jgi:hypothetical protein
MDIKVLKPPKYCLSFVNRSIILYEFLLSRAFFHELKSYNLKVVLNFRQNIL